MSPGGALPPSLPPASRRARAAFQIRIEGRLRRHDDARLSDRMASGREGRTRQPSAATD